MAQKRKNGRPTKFTAPVRKAIIEAVKDGAFREQAAKAAGVMPPTLYKWLQKGREGEPGFAEFAQDVEAASGEARRRAETAVAKTSPFQWLRYGPGREKPGEPGWTDSQRIELDANVRHELNLADALGIDPDPDGEAVKDLEDEGDDEAP